MAAHRKASQQRHPNTQSTSNRRYRQTEAGKTSARKAASKWIKAHPEYNRERARLQKLKRNKVSIIDTGITIVRLMKRDGNLCGICGLGVERADASIDHVLPISKGGVHAWTNVQLAHLSCNSIKGAKTANLPS